MNSTNLIGIMAVLVIGACNYTEGECFPRDQLYETSGVGGGPIIPTGVGGYGDTPPEPSGGVTSVPCNMTEGPKSDAGSNGSADNASGGQEPEQAALKVFCLPPDYGIPCAAQCLAKDIPCGSLAAHPYKPSEKAGKLFSCNSLPLGFMCGYHYSNGDDCYYPYGPAGILPKLCSYSGNP